MTKAVIFDWGRTLYDNENQQLFPETRDVLEHCIQRYDLAIMSIAADESAVTRRLRILQTENLRKYFKITLFHISEKHLLFENILAHLGRVPAEVCVVDDRLQRMTIPIQRGATTIWICRGKFAHELPNHSTGTPTHEIKSLAEVMRIL